MIPYDIDPSLHPAEPKPPQLDDGFSPPRDEQPPASAVRATHEVDPSLLTQSAF